MLIRTQKENYKLFMANTNENNKTSKYKEPPELFFNDMTDIGDLDLNLLNIDQITFKSNDFIIYEIKYLKNLKQFKLSLSCF